MRSLIPTPARARLGRSGLECATVGLGTLAWGDTGRGFGERFGEAELREAFLAALPAEGTPAPPVLFDTAEVYGYKSGAQGQSAEHLLGRFLQEGGGVPTSRAVVGSKVFPVPWTNLLVGGGVRLGREALVSALKASVTRMGGRQLDLWSIHFPFPTFKQAALMEALREGHELGLARAVGVSNYSAAQLEEAAELLERAGGPPLACHQTRFSVLDRKAETEGLLAKARELDVATVAYEPLALGRLAEGGAAREPDGEQAKKLGQLMQILQFIGSVNGGYTVAQAALGFSVAKGAVPIPGCASAARAAELAGLGDWRLDENEVAIVEEKLEFLGL